MKQFLYKFFLIFPAYLFILTAGLSAQATTKKLNILFISSFSKDIPAQTAFELGLDKALSFKKGQHQIFFEFMESPRLAEEDVVPAYAYYLFQKYKNIEFDYVISWATRAGIFLLKNKSLFPNAAKIYVEPAGLNLHKNIELSKKDFIIDIDYDYHTTFNKIIRLEHPSKIIVVGSNQGSGAQSRLDRFKESLGNAESEIQVEYLLDRTLEQVAQKLEMESRKNTIVVYLLMFSDGEGKQMSPYEVVRKLASRSAVPIYTYWASLMGSGVIGGYLFDQEKIGFDLGKSIPFIVKGKKVESFSPMQYIYDWKALKRWEIDKNNLPENAIILNQPPDIFLQYRKQIFIGILFLVIETLLIVTLLINISRRKTAEKELLGYQAELEEKVKGRTIELNREIEKKETLLQELNTERRRLADILDGTNVGTWEWNAKTGETIFNERWAEIIGYTLEEISPVSIETWVKFSHPDDLNVSNELLEKHFKGELDYYDCEIRMQHKNGDWIWVQDRGKISAWSDDGKPLLISGTHQDITDRKQAEEKLKKSQRLLSAIEKIGKVGGWEFSMDTEKLVWTEEIYHLYEVDLTFEPTVENGIKFYTPASRPIIERAVQQAIEHGEPFDVELEIITAKGNRRSIHAIGYADLENRRIYGSFQDITERKQAEKKQKKLEEQLFQAQKMEAIGTLAGGIAHDFNTLLATILGYTNLTSKAIPKDSVIQDYLNSIVSVANQTKNLIKQILDFSRPKEITQEPINLVLVANKSIDFVKKIIPATITVQAEFEADKFMISANEDRITQVLVNLCNNAADFMKNRTGLLKLNISIDNSFILFGKKYVKMSLSDNGAGIDPQMIDRIFDPYFTTKEFGKGSGLGLSIVHQIIKNHNGHIFVESKLEEGTTFSIYFPLLENNQSSR